VSEHVLGEVASQSPIDSFGRWRQMAAAAFISQGLVGVSQKMVSSLPGENRLPFLACTYLVATVLAFIVFRCRGAKLTMAGLVLGGLSGVTCVLSVYFVLAALRQVGGVSAFSIVPASALALTLLAGRVAFGERLSKTQTAGVLLALVGVVLVQLRL